jgi:hydroxypyruvate reductase
MTAMPGPGTANRDATRDALAIWQAGVAAVHGTRLVRDFVSVESNEVRFGSLALPVQPETRLCVAGFGKAAREMAEGLLPAIATIGPRMAQPPFGMVILPGDAPHAFENPDDANDVRDRALNLAGIQVVRARPAHINLPTTAAAKATARLCKMIRGLEPADLCVLLISGGGSSLLTAPRPPLTTGDKARTIEVLTSAGATIRELNALRAAISTVKAGQLVHDCASRNVVALVISDIIGDPLDLVAGGPAYATSPDLQAAWQIVDRYDADRTRLPIRLYEALASRQERPHSQPRRVPHFVLANNQSAVAAAARHARQLGYSAQGTTDVESSDANVAGRALARSLTELNPKTCLISGGEPTVRLAPESQRGRGGRNMQLVLAGLEYILQRDSGIAHDWCMLSGGTDGQDGVTGAAGAWIDAQVVRRAKQMPGSSLRSRLDRNDSLAFFEATGSVLESGPTATNVCDLRIALVAGGVGEE